MQNAWSKWRLQSPKVNVLRILRGSDRSLLNNATEHSELTWVPQGGIASVACMCNAHSSQGFETRQHDSTPCSQRFAKLPSTSLDSGTVSHPRNFVLLLKRVEKVAGNLFLIFFVPVSVIIIIL